MNTPLTLTDIRCAVATGDTEKNPIPHYDSGDASLLDTTLDGIRTSVERGESLPAHWYTKESIAETEIYAIFRKNWQYVAHISDVAHVGNYVSAAIANVPIVVVRNEDGLAGFINVCRHRRMEVMSGRGHAKHMRCPYHAWTYDLKGCLKAAPRAERETDFDATSYSLLPVRVEMLGPFVFAHLDDDARSLAQCYPDVMERLTAAGFDMNALERHSHIESESPVNWKIMLENYLECYHCPTGHPEVSQIVDTRPTHYRLEANGFVLSHHTHVRPDALKRKHDFQEYDPVGTISQGESYFLWPSLTIGFHPGFPNLQLDTWVADGANMTRGVSERYFGPQASAAVISGDTALNTLVTDQDDTLTRSVQRGSRSGFPEKTRLMMDSEKLLVSFQTLVVDAIAKYVHDQKSA